MTNIVTTRSLVIEREIPHHPEKIWRALTEGPLIAEWLMTNDFPTGCRPSVHLPRHACARLGRIIDSEVLLAEPNSRLSYGWTSMGLETVVTLDLTPNPGGTHLRMEQSGFPSEEGANYKGAKYGWTNFIGKLEHVVGGLQ